ncbi:hypothetical protein K469DRAFT_716699 [Zopfia rhizophila CBS 207.26]|uniref:Uncharacterized protein n=1 Tax=Zopfia rhizophila CBS 207.26 TaxID=1314779 RepID=A0A6A6EMM5_9PEZI|nr:hypothetical protein K469DRAFT_716699 [Zopfia rhizophila CBS 207.26]
MKCRVALGGVANLVIDGHRTATWFIFCNTGRHDLIIGRKWIELTRTMLDPINRRIVWPEDAKIDAKRDTVIPKDADRGDKLLDAPALRRGTSWHINPAITIASLGPASAPLAPYKLVDYILQVNRSINALQPYRGFIKHHKQDWKPD